MKNIDKLRLMDEQELAKKLCFDDEGNKIGVCNCCIYQDDCCDLCYIGVMEWLKSEA